MSGSKPVSRVDSSRPGADDSPPRLPRSEQSTDTQLAVEIRGLVAEGQLDLARVRFARLVERQQRRALRIAYQYLRDEFEVDEAVQDAFLRVFRRIETYREAWPFEVWFTRILVNGCLDRRKARTRRNRWFAPAEEATAADEARQASSRGFDSSPESLLLARERRARLAAAIDRLDGRQRSVFMLCHFGDCTPREVSAIMGLKESTVRVHLFRAAHKLRGLLGATQ